MPACSHSVLVLHPENIHNKNKNRENNLCLCPSHVFCLREALPNPIFTTLFIPYFLCFFHVRVTILLFPLCCLQQGITNQASLPGLQGRITRCVEALWKLSGLYKCRLHNHSKSPIVVSKFPWKEMLSCSLFLSGYTPTHTVPLGWWKGAPTFTQAPGD